jgi:D-aspartate ligase
MTDQRVVRRHQRLHRSIRSEAPALVVGGGINGLGIVRNLGREGVQVYCLVDGPDPVAYSKYCQKCFVIPYFSERIDILASFLSGFRRELKEQAVVFPTDDMSVLALSDLQYRMKDQFAFIVPSGEVAEKLVLKSKFYESLLECKVPHPRIATVGDAREARNAARDFGYPLYIRPSLSPHFSRVFGQKGFVAHSEDQLVHYYRLVSARNIEVILQEIVPGPDTNMYGISGFFDSNHRPAALFGYHRLRGWPRGFGNSSLMESVPLSRLEIPRKTLVEYLAKLGYYGIMDAEFKLDARDGSYKLLEINARSWWQNSFPAKCGLNIVLRSYLDAIGEKTVSDEGYEGGVKWINVVDDIRSAIVGRDVMSQAWIRSFYGVKDYAFFDAADKRPLASHLFSTWRAFTQRRRRDYRRSHTTYLSCR